MGRVCREGGWGGLRGGRRPDAGPPGGGDSRVAELGRSSSVQIEREGNREHLERPLLVGGEGKLRFGE